MDPLCPGDIMALLRLEPPSLWELMQRLDPGKPHYGLSRDQIVPLSNWGVGVLPLAHDPGSALKLSPMYVALILGWLCEGYDLFFDVAPYPPMELFSWRFADLVFWVCPPDDSHLQATARRFAELSKRGLPMDRFEIVINGKERQELPAKAVTKFVANMKKRVLAWMPHDDAIPVLTEKNGIFVLESMHTEWLESGLRVLLGRAVEASSYPKNWDVRGQTWSEFESGVR